MSGHVAGSGVNGRRGALACDFFGIALYHFVMNYHSDYTSRARSYRGKAKEAHALAETMTVPEAKAALIKVAADYARMAETLERLATDQKKG